MRSTCVNEYSFIFFSFTLKLKQQRALDALSKLSEREIERRVAEARECRIEW